jgi:hypothetical protein
MINSTMTVDDASGGIRTAEILQGLHKKILYVLMEIQAGGETQCSEIHKLIKLIWNREELPHQWKESIVIPIHKKCDKTDCSDYRGRSLLPTSYKILSNILLARLIACAYEIIGDHQSEFWHNRSTTDQIFYIWQILEKKW